MMGWMKGNTDFPFNVLFSLVADMREVLTFRDVEINLNATSIYWIYLSLYSSNSSSCSNAFATLWNIRCFSSC